MAIFKKLDCYKDLSQASLEINRAIHYDMPKEARYDIGDEIRKILRDMKYLIYLINSRNDVEKIPYFEQLVDNYNHIRILLDECIENGFLKIKGKFSMAQPIKRLISFGKQISKWQAYTRKKNIN